MTGTPKLATMSVAVSLVSVMFWVLATWLILPLIAVGLWQHLKHRTPLRYEAPLWELAFPVGMYGVASDLLGHAAGLRLVSSIGAIEN